MIRYNWIYAALLLFMFVRCQGKTGNKAIQYKVVLNPDCKKYAECLKNATMLIQIIVQLSNRSIHFLLPGSGKGAPLSIIMLETDAIPDKLHVNWTKFLSRKGDFYNSISLNGVHTSYGVIIYQVIQSSIAI